MYSKTLVKFGQGVNIFPKKSEWRRTLGMVCHQSRNSTRVDIQAGCRPIWEIFPVYILCRCSESLRFAIT